MSRLTASDTPSPLHSVRGVLALGVAVTAWRLATLVANPINLSFDEAQYWLWSQSFAFGYFSKPPLVAWVIALTTGLCGEGEVCVKLGSPLAYLVGSLAVFFLGRRLFDARTGFWAAALFLTLPGVALSAMLISVDPFLLLFWALALLAFVRALDDDRAWRWLVLGGLIGLGLLAKYAMAMFALSLWLYLAWSPERRRLLRRPGPWLAMAAALLVLAPNLVWNAGNGFVTLAHTKANANLGQGLALHPRKLAEFLGSQFAVFGPFAFAALLWFLARAKRTLAMGEPMRLLLAFTVPVLLIMTVESLLSRANANWSAPAYVAGSVLVAAAALRLGRTWILTASLAVHLGGAAVLYNVDALAHLAGVELSARTDPYKHVRGWNILGREVGRLWAANPGTVLLFDQRKVMAPLLYYVRPHPFDAVKWKPPGARADHFDLTTDLEAHRGRDFLLVTGEPNDAHVAPSFARSELVAVLRVPLYRDYLRHVRVYRLEGYKGFAR